MYEQYYIHTYILHILQGLTFYVKVYLGPFADAKFLFSGATAGDHFLENIRATHL